MIKRVTKPDHRAIGYCRVSTADQADLGVSLDAQTERIRGCLRETRALQPCGPAFEDKNRARDISWHGMGLSAFLPSNPWEVVEACGKGLELIRKLYQSSANR
jgi:hypothetical protein